MDTSFASDGVPLGTDGYFPLEIPSFWRRALMSAIGLLCLMAGLGVLVTLLVKISMIQEGFAELFQDFTWAGLLTLLGVLAFLLLFGIGMAYSGLNHLFIVREEVVEAARRQAGTSKYGLLHQGGAVELRAFADSDVIKCLVFRDGAHNYRRIPGRVEFSEDEERVGGGGGGSTGLVKWLRLDWQADGARKSHIIKSRFELPVAKIIAELERRSS